MRKIKIKEIVCIIGLLGTLTAHSQNTVWQIGNKDNSAKEFKFYKTQLYTLMYQKSKFSNS